MDEFYSKLLNDRLDCKQAVNDLTLSENESVCLLTLKALVNAG
ncbi:MAG: hypothetical protein ACI9V8_000301 [Urechidicola sp.]|jgi:hypothetical protein